MKNYFGKYQSHYSIIHKLDPRVKFLGYILGLIAIFLQAGFIPYFTLLLTLIIIFVLADLSFKSILNIFKTILFLWFFLIIFNLIEVNIGQDTSHASEPIHKLEEKLWEWRFLAFSWKTLIISSYYALRVFLVIFLTLILVSTTEPKALTFAIEKILSPLKLIHLPIHIFVMIISLTIRLVPTLIEEVDHIIIAQSSRGLDFYNSNLKQKFKVLIALIIPLIASVFKRADEMAIAMESRGYNPYKKRTSFQQFYFLKINFLFWAIILGLFIFLIIYKVQFYDNSENITPWLKNLDVSLKHAH